MNPSSNGQIRRSQVITTYGPGSLIDLPKDSAIVAGVDDWHQPLERLDEPRVQRTLSRITGVANPYLYVPPTPDPAQYWLKFPKGIDAYRFPEWFVVQESGRGDGSDPSPTKPRSRRLVHRKHLDEKRKFDGNPVVATRFVRACPKGHVDDFPWQDFAHSGPTKCLGQLWLDETGATGELANLRVRCSCGKSRRMTEANDISKTTLGICTGARPWLGPNANEDCHQRSRLLIRTATNAYFPLLVRALSIPEKSAEIDLVVAEQWQLLEVVESLDELAIFRKLPQIAQSLAGFDDDEILEAIHRRREGPLGDQSVKGVEIEAMLAVPEGFGDDVPIDPNFHARKFPDHLRTDGFRQQVSGVYQVHRLREVLALGGFTRLEAPMPDIDGEYRDEVERADISIDPAWFPAVENRGEGVLLHFSAAAVRKWKARAGVARRTKALQTGYLHWREQRKNAPDFPGGTYVMLHTLSHMLVQSLSSRCGYPAASIRERIYVDDENELYGVLLYTSSPDAEGTLGGLVQQARHIGGHIEQALAAAGLCSNDPVCAQHSPASSVEERWLHGAACHGCVLVAETSCEMWNDNLDRALVVPTLDERDAAFFPDPGWA
ncbi:MAG: DUF1998 domain-containing protein [Gammaproteobacteria bacterium]|nr:DUF1998 domain-containing protein [Gammaproteobacteria bacterium]MDE0258740.1 DUF1998 domain-containing protein [Gammaproteobacteria bacterium]